MMQVMVNYPVMTQPRDHRPAGQGNCVYVRTRTWDE